MTPCSRISVLAVLAVAGLAQPSAGADVPAEDLDKIRFAASFDPPAKPKQPRSVLVFSKAEGFVHESIPWGAAALRILGEKTGAYTATVSDDPAMFDRERLSQFDAVVFNNNCGNPVADPQRRANLLEFVHRGRGLAGIHCAAHVDWPEFIAMLGGYSIDHPWNAGSTVGIQAEEPEHPLVRCFATAAFSHTDEIFVFKGFSREKVRVLLRLDTARTDMNKPGVADRKGDYPLSWVSRHGQGRVFYCALGHQKDVYWQPAILKHYLAGIQFAAGDLEADSAPRPATALPAVPQNPAGRDQPTIVNETTWNDTDGKPIAAHDGGISRFGDRFYWYGTSYAGNPKGKFGIAAGEIWNGVQCYSSADLVHWKNEGAVLPRPKRGWCKTATCVRPKVLFHAKSGTYVMWYSWHLHYPSALMMVAVADRPNGPFRILGPRETGAPDGFGYDMGLFQDDDGTAYLVYCDSTYNTRIDRLSDDYQSSQKDGIVALPPQHEAPAMTRCGGKYLVAASGVNGWDATETVYAVASSPLGPYGLLKTMSQQKTWRSQITCFFHVKESDTLVAMCDQWWIPDKTDLNKSRYLWLPVDFDPAAGTARMIYREQWKPREKKTP